MVPAVPSLLAMLCLATVVVYGEGISSLSSPPDVGGGEQGADSLPEIDPSLPRPRKERYADHNYDYSMSAGGSGTVRCTLRSGELEPDAEALSDYLRALPGRGAVHDTRARPAPHGDGLPAPDAGGRAGRGVRGRRRQGDRGRARQPPAVQRPDQGGEGVRQVQGRIPQCQEKDIHQLQGARGRGPAPPKPVPSVRGQGRGVQEGQCYDEERRIVVHCGRLVPTRLRRWIPSHREHDASAVGAVLGHVGQVPDPEDPVAGRSVLREDKGDADSACDHREASSREQCPEGAHDTRGLDGGIQPLVRGTERRQDRVVRRRIIRGAYREQRSCHRGAGRGCQERNQAKRGRQESPPET
mmetsp:Transcript_18299/g.42072  ORF Transcript_18299/g.42072 Transcript_18299/m.42072 type:complete len:355 (-) Transcript_18299:542-1606(-)